MTLHFTPTTAGSTFISRRGANPIPFTSADLPQILNHFSVEHNSVKAEEIANTLLECEEPSITGETKHCATSLKSMVEFTTTTLNTHNVIATSTTIDKKNSPKQKYTIKSSEMLGSNLAVCHAQTCACVVFYCHMTSATEAYEVSMVGEEGAKAEEVAICHADTGGWNTKHVAFRVLGVKPRSVPVCHFLPQDLIAWSCKK